jgi:hypothetical protein
MHPTAGELGVENRSESHEIGDRYVLQYAGGVERLAQARRLPGEEPALHPIETEHPLPSAALLTGEWLVGPRDRLIRDGIGRYWCVSSRAVHRSGRGGPSWRVRFERYSSEGHALHLTADTRHDPAMLADAELVEILRRAWGASDA